MAGSSPFSCQGISKDPDLQLRLETASGGIANLHRGCVFSADIARKTRALFDFSSANFRHEVHNTAQTQADVRGRVANPQDLLLFRLGMAMSLGYPWGTQRP